ncbi:MAG TPA: YdcF family protein [Xanthomonadaceae bacterium]|nr:YdcF family protein [Xanthomonadaceae bacterium]
MLTSVLHALGELVVALTYPPTLTAAVLMCAGLALLLRWRRLAVGLAAGAIAWSALWSVPEASDWLRHTLARQYPPVADAALPRADAIVVLGGGQYRWLRDPELDPYLLERSRLAAGARAWLEGRAPVVILSGGSSGGRGLTEAGRMAEAIGRMGVPRSALLLEERSRDTAGNARFTAQLARQRHVRSILLVTSAVHMPRASLLFREAGLQVVPVPVPEGAERVGWRERWLPSPGALWRSGRALKEYAGLLSLRVLACA